MTQTDKENYMKAIIGEAEYEANLEDWKEEGLAEGMAQGMAEGMAQGMAEGMAQGKVEVAKKMRSLSVDKTIIAQCTGLTIEEIEAL